MVSRTRAGSYPERNSGPAENPILEQLLVRPRSEPGARREPAHVRRPLLLGEHAEARPSIRTRRLSVASLTAWKTPRAFATLRRAPSAGCRVRATTLRAGGRGREDARILGTARNDLNRPHECRENQSSSRVRHARASRRRPARTDSRHTERPGHRTSEPGRLRVEQPRRHTTSGWLSGGRRATRPTSETSRGRRESPWCGLSGAGRYSWPLVPDMSSGAGHRRVGERSTAVATA
jgi:hypothetical protein